MQKPIDAMKDHEFFEFIKNEDNIYKFFVENSIIKENFKCFKCRIMMKKKINRRKVLNVFFECKKCCLKKNTNDFLEKNLKKISFLKIMKFLYYFYEKIHFKKSYVKKQIGISNETYANLLNL